MGLMRMRNYSVGRSTSGESAVWLLWRFTGFRPDTTLQSPEIDRPALSATAAACLCVLHTHFIGYTAEAEWPQSQTSTR